MDGIAASVQDRAGKRGCAADSDMAAIDGVSAVEMSLEGKSATLTLAKEVSDQVLTDTVTQAGYEVVSVQ